VTVFGKDDAGVNETKVSRFDCTKCGPFVTTKYPTNDHEATKIIREHLNAKHGGVWHG